MIEFDGVTVHLTATKGLRDLGRSVAAPGTDLHCLDLAEAPVEEHTPRGPSAGVDPDRHLLPVPARAPDDVGHARTELTMLRDGSRHDVRVELTVCR
jgi:hypothetical protein